MRKTPQLDIFADAPAEAPEPFSPFRAKLRTATSEQIESLNEAYGLTGARAIEPTELALRRIEETKSPSDSRLWSWALHPDERVQIALIRSQHITSQRESTRFAADVIWYQAIRNQRHDGQDTELWNPVLDAVADKRVWPRTPTCIENRRDLPFEIDRKIPFMPVDDYLRTVREWAASVTDPAEFVRLFDTFRSTELLKAIIRGATVMDVPTAKAIAARSPACMEQLARNRWLNDDVVEYLKTWAFEAITNIGELVKHPRFAECDLYRGLGAGVMLGLEAQGRTLARADHERLIAMLANATEGDEWATSPRLQASMYYRDRAQTLPPEILELVLPALPGRRGLSWFIPLVLERNDLTVGVARVIAKHFDSPKVRAMLAADARWRNDPEIRSILIESASSEVARHTLLDANEQEFPRIFRRIAPTHPAVAAAGLAARMDEMAPVLAREDLLPLLQADEANARITAMQAISLVQAKRTRSRAR